ncbi:MAG: hypothetical protein OXR73_00390 [Myxococcales bacterium]|nr:hypothetical protein [Myxococcales bacterium]
MGYAAGAFETWYGCEVVSFSEDEHGEKRTMILAQDVTDRPRTAWAGERSAMCFRQLMVEQESRGVLGREQTAQSRSYVLRVPVTVHPGLAGGEV